MAFWGVEIKPGKPVTYHHDPERGRLHVSQATLGSGSSAKKAHVQCNVGNKSPVFLCTLLPDKLESCSLNIEFEEEEEVVFSVLGPTSVYLTGFFRGCSVENNSDSYGEDIDVESERSSGYSEDEYEEDFIDDSDLDEFPDSPLPNSGVKIEEIIDDEKPENGHALQKRLKKKHQRVESDDEDNSKQLSESEDEDGLPLSSVPLNKSASKVVDTEVKPAKGQSQDGNISKKQTEENGEQETSLKRKIDAIDGEGDPQKKVSHSCGSSMTAGTVVLDNGSKPKKKKKDKVKDDKVLQDQVNTSTDKTEEADLEKMEDQPVIAKPNAVVPNDRSVNGNADNVADGQDKSKKKKKKKVKAQVGDENTGAKELKKDIKGQEASLLENKAEEQPQRGARTFSNGLVIEELSMGKPDGKRASPGSKIAVFYIGKLKKNGEIFDSNIGQKPFKFRLGIGEVIKGWDVGVNGMRIGDKRRLTIPPSMGYGAKGAGKIPGNAWLMFDVELVNVH